LSEKGIAGAVSSKMDEKQEVAPRRWCIIMWKGVFKIVIDNVTTISSVFSLSSSKTPARIHGNDMIVKKKIYIGWYVYKTFELFHAFVILLGSWVLE
jgi:hypothetical protein